MLQQPWPKNTLCTSCVLQLGNHYLAPLFLILNTCLLLNGSHALSLPRAHTHIHTAGASSKKKAWQPYISRDDLLLQPARLHRDLLLLLALSRIINFSGNAAATSCMEREEEEKKHTQKTRGRFVWQLVNHRETPQVRERSWCLVGSVGVCVCVCQPIMNHGNTLTKQHTVETFGDLNVSQSVWTLKACSFLRKAAVETSAPPADPNPSNTSVTADCRAWSSFSVYRTTQVTVWERASLLFHAFTSQLFKC